MINAIRIRITIILLVLCGGIFLFLKLGRNEISPPLQRSTPSASASVPLITPHETPVELSIPSAEPEVPNRPLIKLFSAASLPEANPVYDFGLYTPALWEAAYVQRSASINLYNASASSTPMENSQVFIRYFRGNTFLTLSSVKVISRRERVVGGRPAVEYLIEKKPGYPNFPNQPFWRNARHRVVDVRISDENPSYFYVFAKRPDLADEVFDAILDTLVIAPKDPVSPSPNASLH